MHNRACAQALRPALPRAAMGGQVDPRHRAARHGHVPRDRPGPRRADAAARRSRRSRVWRSRSTAIWPRLRVTAPPNLVIVEGDFLDAQPGGHPRGGQAGRHVAPGAMHAARRRESSLQRRLADSVQADRAVSGRDSVSTRPPSCCSGRSRIGWSRSPGSRDYGVLSVLVRHGRRRRTAADASAGRVSAGAEGATPPSSGCAFTPTSRRPETPKLSKADAGGVHAAAKDPRQRAAGLSTRRARPRFGAPWTRRGSTAPRRPETPRHRRVRAARGCSRRSAR